MITEGFTPQLSHSTNGANALRIGIAARSFDRAQIATELIAMRQALREFIVDLSDEQLSPPRLETINPPLWEAAHVAWFSEWFCVRNAYNTENGYTRADAPSMWIDSDAFLNSNLITHDARWSLPQVTRAATLDYLDRSLDATLRALDRASNHHESLYRFRLAMFHEAMHMEAFAWAAQTLAWKMPAWVNLEVLRTEEKQPSNYVVNQTIKLGNKAINSCFRFDNEIGLSTQLNRTIDVSAELVSNQQFVRFVECGDYERSLQRKHPIYWRHTANGDWQQRRFDQWIALDASEPVIHVSAHEAEAYARWIGGRLPTEGELHTHFNAAENAWHGKLWEWTSTSFAPYVAVSEFKPGLYREYSQPWFDGKHRVLRGGSFATLPIMHHPHYRNFFTPRRSDVFTGFRVVTS
ncbi:MAG: SUMF1/EgtB/PvdO family nonheme iron enzyme [Casimicrobium sp.]